MATLSKRKRLANRIVGEADVDPKTLLAHPLNWRRHPEDQQSAVDSLLARVGWVQRVVVNRRTNRVLDGHLRVDLAKRRGEASIPVVFVDVPERDERLVLASLDSSARMAGTDDDELDTLLGHLDTEDRDLAARVFAVADRELRSVRKAERTPKPATPDRYFVEVAVSTPAAQMELMSRLTAEGLHCRSVVR